MNRTLDWLIRAKTHAVSMAAIMLALIGWVDYLTGFEVGLGFFYLFPIMLAAWSAGCVGGLLMAGISATMWAGVQVGAGHPCYAQLPLHLLWNSIMRLAVFGVVACLVASLRGAFVSERSLARTDALTRITNRRHFLALLHSENERSFGRQRHPLSVAFIDIDDFKSLNDTAGHHVGDRALSLIASVLSENVRDIDVVGRLGGDEFAILLPQTDREDAQIVVARFLQAVTFAIRSQGWPIGLSIGVVTVEGGRIDVERLLQLADATMYQAKRAGKNRIEYAVVEKGSEEPAQRTADPLAWANVFRRPFHAVK